MPNRSASPSTYSNLSATEDYQPPNAADLAALLSENEPVRSYEYINSRESTPCVGYIPPGLEQTRASVLAGQRKLEEKYGKPTAIKIRQSISCLHYWKTEVAHFAKLCNLTDEEQLDERELSRRATSDMIRNMIKDVNYWKIEAAELAGYCVEITVLATTDTLRKTISNLYYWETEYIRYMDHLGCAVMESIAELKPELSSTSTSESKQELSSTSTAESKPELSSTSTAEFKQELSLKSTQRPSGIRKRKNGSRPTSRVASKDAPVSSRLRNSQRVRKGSARGQRG